MRTVTADEYRALFAASDEFAVIDTREISAFYYGHLLAASNVPLSRLEIDIEKLVPRRGTHIVLSDWASAWETEERLSGLGYHNISVISGGLAGWHLAGGRIFPGWNVIGKSFGSYYETIHKTPTISAQELAKILEGDDKPLILDTRTIEEHSDYCLPGSISCPNGEMIYRALAFIDDPDRLIVTHCAGRTRGIIGARALLDAGVKNRVVSLAKGTLEWTLSGYELERGAFRPLPAPENLELARVAAARLQAKHGVVSVNTQTLKSWQAEIAERTLYLFDIRTEEEVAKGTWPGARPVLGGQLLQGVDRNIATRGARIVLMDCDGIRSIQIGSILRQMGYRDVYSFSADPGLLSPPQFSANEAVPETSALATLNDPIAYTILDIRGGVKFRDQHIAGSWLIDRANINRNETLLPQTTTLVLLSDEPKFAALVAADLRRLGREALVRLDPLPDWQSAGFNLESGIGLLAGEPSDAVYDLESREVHIRDAHEYLGWLEGLFDTIADDPATPYMRAKEA